MTNAKDLQIANLDVEFETFQNSALYVLLIKELGTQDST